MNEVRATQVAMTIATGSASSKGAAGAPSRETGKQLPVEQPEKPQAEVKPQPEVDLREAVADMNDYIQSVQRDLHFAVDEDLDQTVIKVVDRDTGELIRQIPEEVFLDLARKMKAEQEPFHLVNAQG
ncbi:flagellar protein FlaG [Simiduia agarivorans]|uniref:FlaG protein n=1 Tax=Simiduia agarivorans (strain DSM 21679 / JCM 13881 / BCRC 17597 / SA1) TaxID=1117647 RepID=K4KF58_SIMAS|nr:flagellar protein FlaG [Simiduia agarivorans]AFU97674.2 FlaG protein [Simiduia agarivorans SA1 = DSM 21679]